MASPKKKRQPHKKKREEVDDVERALIERLEQLKKPHQQQHCCKTENIHAKAVCYGLLRNRKGYI